MANRVSEAGTAKALTANASTTVAVGAVLLSFICSSTGSITITDSASGSMLAATPVTAGGFLPILFECPIGATVTLSGGASGTLVVA